MLDFLFGPPGRMTSRDNQGWRTYSGRLIGGMKTQAGPVVDEDVALTYAAVWAATRVISETVGHLPLMVYERNGNDRIPAVGSPWWSVVHDQPNPRMGNAPFREGRTMHCANWGNGFAEIERNGRGDIVATWPIHPSRVRPVLKGDTRATRGESYWVLNNDGSAVPMFDNELLHIPGALSEDGRWGKGVITHARESVGFGLGTERHGATYFGSGALPKGVVFADGLKDQEARRGFREEWKDVHGSPDSGEIAIIPKDGKFMAVSVSNEDSQFLETRKHNDIVVCQWYGLPPHAIGNLDRANFSNIEQLSINLVIYSLMPWARRTEGEYNRKIFTPEERKRFYVEHNFAGLLRGDMASRMTAYVHALQNGIMTINEVRRLENLPGIGPAGDQNYVQLNMTTAQRLLEAPTAKEATSTAVAVPALPAPAAEQLAIEAVEEIRRETNADAILAAESALKEALGRMFTKEAKAVGRAIDRKGLDFEAWLREFHGSHERTIEQAVAPACGMLQAVGRKVTAESVAGDCTRDSRDLLLKSYNRDSRDIMAARLETWSETMTRSILKIHLGE